MLKQGVIRIVAGGLLAFLGGCEASIPKQEITVPVALSFNLQADSTYRYSIKNNIVLRQQIDKDNEMSINQNMTLVASYKVAAAHTDSRDISVTYERITMSSGNEIYSIDYDSENDNGTEVMYEDLRNLIDKTFKMSVSSKGEVLSSQPVIGAHNNGSGAYKVNDSSIRKIMLHALNIYPGKPVRAGDIWEAGYTTSVGFANLRVKNKYRLLSVKDSVAKLELQGRLTSDKNDSGNSMRLDGVQNGSFEINIHTGLVNNAKISQQLSGEMNVTGKSTPVEVESEIYILGSKKQAGR